jgi:hypothetical protein
VDSQHAADYGHHASRQAVQTVQEVDRVHHAHEPEDGPTPDNGPGEPFRAEEEPVGEGVVDVLDVDDEGNGDEAGQELRQILRFVAKLEPVV